MLATDNFTVLDFGVACTKRLPKVYFAVDTKNIWIRSFNLFSQEIQEHLVGKENVDAFVSEVLFRPATTLPRSSNAAHIADVRDADIFISLHSAARAVIPLLKEGAIVIELSNRDV